MSDEALWTIEDVARLCSVTPRTIRNWQAAGTIPYVKLGRVVRFQPHEIRVWLSDQAKITRQAERREDAKALAFTSPRG